MGWSGLVERDSEFRLLCEAWQAARPGTPQVLMVEGPAGVGKSALLARFLADHGDATTLNWTGEAAETDLPFGMVGQLLPDNSRWVDPFTAGRALLARVGERASDGPLLLSFDDLHLADRPSLVALNFAIRRLRHDPVLVVFTVRSNHVGELPGSMVRMATDTGHRVTLNGLSTSAIRKLAAELGVGHVSWAAADRLRAITDGSPLHLRALLREVGLEDLEELERPLPAPASFAQLVLADFAATRKTSRQVATAAAVLGERTEIADLATVAGVDTDSCLSALEELTGAGLLRVPAGGRCAEFAHPLVRAAIYTDLGPAARSLLHRRAAGVRDGYAALQHRIAATLTTDAELSTDLDSWATDQRRAGNLTSAASALLAAHRVTPPGPDADSRLLAAVQMLAVAGNAKAAQQHSASLATMPESGRWLAVQAQVAWLAGRDDEAASLATRAWDREDLAPDEHDLVAAMLAQIEILRDNPTDAVAWAHRALGEGRLDPTLASHTRAQQALAIAVLGRPEDALTALADLPEDASQVNPTRHPELMARGHLKTWGGPQAAAQEDLAVSAALTHGDMQPLRLNAAAGLAQSLFHSGDWDRSLAIAEQILALAEDMEQTWIRGFLHAVTAWVPTGRGRWEEAQQHVDAALALARGGFQATQAFADDATAFLGFCRGDPQAVVEATARLRSTRDSSPQRELGMFRWPLHLVVALIDLGRLDEADAELQRITARTRRGHVRAHAAVLRVTGQLAAARHDLGRARDCLAEAIEMADARVDALEQALALEAFGRFLRRRGERRAAVERLRAARTRFQALRAEPFVTRCDDELAACGVHDPSTATPPDPLTSQERVVATLICAGRTNRQAADELVLSVKTIGYHLTNVYAKLGVHTRAQLVAAMRDLAAGHE